jgi:hypothetical protein
MATGLNRLGFRFRKVGKAKPQKTVQEPEAIFDNMKKKDQQAVASEGVKRLSMDGTATVHIGAFSRGGLTRGAHKACDHDLGCKEKSMPCGIVEEESGQLRLSFGSSYTTSDCMVDALASWWHTLDAQEQKDTKSIQIKMDHGPESSGRRTQFLHRMVQCVDAIGKPVQLLYDPPYHSKYNPIERCWGLLALHWNGTQLIDVATM